VYLYVNFLKNIIVMIMIMIEIQYSDTALLLLHILHRNNSTVFPTYVFIIWKEDALFTAMFNLLCSSTNQQLFKKNFCNHYENYRWFPLQMESIVYLPTKLTLFMESRDEWDTKEGTGKSMKNALHV